MSSVSEYIRLSVSGMLLFIGLLWAGCRMRSSSPEGAEGADISLPVQPGGTDIPVPDFLRMPADSAGNIDSLQLLHMNYYLKEDRIYIPMNSWKYYQVIILN